MKLFIACLLALPLFASALTNSTPALETEFDSVVSVNSDQLSDGQRFPGYCNATMIHPRVLISAAHCWASTYQLRDQRLNYQFGQYIYKTQPDGKQKRIGYATKLKGTAKVQFYFTRSLTQQLNSNRQGHIDPNNDIAIAVLSEPIAGADIFGLTEVISKSEHLGIQSRLTQYWPTVVSINYTTEMSTDTRKKMTLNQASANGGHYTSNSSSRVEEGDSGAPLIVRIGKSWKVAGVVKGRAETIFSNWDVYTMADNKLCDIASQITDPEIKKAICK